MTFEEKLMTFSNHIHNIRIDFRKVIEENKDIDDTMIVIQSEQALEKLDEAESIIAKILGDE
jgi:hypothetical protein